jgi:hypothetical protein
VLFLFFKVLLETTATFNEIPQTRTEHETNVSQQISITNQKQKSHIPNNENSIPTGTSNSAQTENLELRLSFSSYNR